MGPAADSDVFVSRGQHSDFLSIGSINSGALALIYSLQSEGRGLDQPGRCVPAGANIMAASHLIPVPNATNDSVASAGEIYDLGREVETGAQRVRRLQHEARMLAREQIEAFARDLGAMAARAAEIAEGGDVYPVGARELASRISDDLPQKAQLLATIMSRTALS